MILDTSYFLPLARIDVDSDILLAMAERRASSDKVSFDRIGLNSISIFELQAKAAKLRIRTEYVIEAIDMISKTFKVIPHTLDGIVETASILRQTFFTDYVDCVIIATAIELKEELLTEDSKILRIRKELKEKYDLPISKFADVIGAGR